MKEQSQPLTADECPNCKAHVELGKGMCPHCGATIYPRERRYQPPIWPLVLCWLGVIAFGLVGGCGVYVGITGVIGPPDDLGIWVIGWFFAAICLPVAALFFGQIRRLLKRRN